MKKLLILFLFLIPLISEAQTGFNDDWRRSDTLVAGTDSLVIDTLKTYTKMLDLTVSDSGATYTDSVIVEIWDNKLEVWCPLSVGNYSNMTEYSYAVPGAGNSRMFSILFESGSRDVIIRQRLYNLQYIAGRRVLTSLKITNNF